MSNLKTRRFVLAGIFSAIIVVMTLIPYTGYINYGLIEITTLHIPVILGAVFLGWKYGALLGFVWGVTCFARAFTNPLWIAFTNPLISVLPRILVGAVAGLVFAALKKTRLAHSIAAALSAVAATLTNTVLVLSAIYVFGGMFKSYATFFQLFEEIIQTIITVNGAIEIVAAAIVIPVLYRALARFEKAYQS